MLHRRGLERGADAREHRLARFVVGIENPHLDELVGAQVDVDFVQHALGQPLLADADHRLQPVRPGTQVAPLGWGQEKHDSRRGCARWAHHFARLPRRRPVPRFGAGAEGFSSGR